MTYHDASIYVKEAITEQKDEEQPSPSSDLYKIFKNYE